MEMTPSNHSEDHVAVSTAVGYARQGQYVEAFRLQNRNGPLSQLSVRAELDVWGIGHYNHSGDDPLTSAQARQWAQGLIGDPQKVLVLVLAFVRAAAEVEEWDRELVRCLR